MKQLHRITLGISGLMLALIGSNAVATPYAQTNLVSDIPGLAQITDPALKNPWGMSFSGTSPFWISDQGTNNATLYRVTNGTVSQVAVGGAADIAIPTTAAGPQGPTGQVFNSAGAGAFVVQPNTTNQANFIFANLNGTISAWNPTAGASAVIKATTAGAVYTGLAITGTGANARLYAANSAGSGSIDIFDSTFTRIPAPVGAFVDPAATALGLVPFNVTTLGGNVYVTYALPGRAAQIAATAGQGALAVFNTAGVLQNAITGSQLASPWGVALAPGNFGQFSNDLLIGNFSFALSEINAFDPITGQFLGTLGTNAGTPLIQSPFASNGLWAIEFGNGTTAPTNALLFAAGINSEGDGLVGLITAVPEPESVALFGIGLLALFAGARRRRRN